MRVFFVRETPLTQQLAALSSYLLWNSKEPNRFFCENVMEFQAIQAAQWILLNTVHDQYSTLKF